MTKRKQNGSLHNCAWCNRRLGGRQQRFCCWQHKKLYYRYQERITAFFGDAPDPDGVTFAQKAYLRGFEARLRSPEGIDICMDILRRIGLSGARRTGERRIHIHEHGYATTHSR